MQKVNSWEKSVAEEIGLAALSYTNHDGGRIELHLPCYTDSDVHNVCFARRFPPEVIRKKLQEKGWDTHKMGKFRCPSCTAHRVKKNGNCQHGEETMDTKPQPSLFRLTKNDTAISLTISKQSDLIKEFVDDNFKPSSYWGFEVSHDKDGRAQLILERKTMPEGMQKARGIARGSFHEKGGTFSATISNSLIPGSEQIKNTGSIGIDFLSHQGKYIIFCLPDTIKSPVRIPTAHKEQVVKKPAYRPTSPTEEKAAIAPPPKTVEEPKPAPVEDVMVEERVEVAVAAPEPELKQAASKVVDMLAPEARTDIIKPITSKDDIGLMHAIEMVNYYKTILGDRMDLSISSSGTLRVMVEYG